MASEEEDLRTWPRLSGLSEEQNRAVMELVNAIDWVENNPAATRPPGWARIVAAKDEVDKLFFEKLD